MSLGVLGGTFNPVHRAHLRLAAVARERLGLERVILVPAGDPPLKSSGIASAAHRLAMLELAVDDVERLEISTIEIEREGKSYTVHTLEALRAAYPDRRLWFVLGADALAQLDLWYQRDRLLELASFAVAQRPGSARELAELVPERLAEAFAKPAPDRWVHASGQELVVLPFDPLDVSATEVRRRVARGEPIDDLVPGPVARYIAEQGLYREAA